MDQNIFLAKKREAEMIAKLEKDRQYQTMFKPKLIAGHHSAQRHLSGSNIEPIDSTSVRSVNHHYQEHIERSDNLYLAGKSKLQKIKGRTEDDLNNLERTYDENLTF